MKHPFRRLAILIALVTAPAAQAAPNVLADVPPIHAIAARVMAGVGTPGLILPPGSDPHSAALRPSEARALADADLVIWTGPALTPWLERALDALAGDARHLALMETPGLVLLDLRRDAAFAPPGGAHEHDHDHDHDHAPGADAESHADTAAMDPHIWLDSANAARIAEAIAGQLSTLDPAGAETYAANARAFAGDLESLEVAVADALPDPGTTLVVTHDVLQYFEAHFGLTVRGAIAPGDASAPGAARLRQIGDWLSGPSCILAEPQLGDGFARSLAEDHGAKVVIIDPLGLQLPTGAELYPALMNGLATAIGSCED
ncbi:zinc ABC transporter substrate-binding protein [Oceanibium sediminis]|uniref:zinc ABC transporter substrate-binding protein n=1 Tax=Oceanibium sediminis TaxID=2026339 RepID=UPI001300A30F|nr:zinc ABC transporter substrate-binding protein [Oceanibium sediminis]